MSQTRDEVEDWQGSGDTQARSPAEERMRAARNPALPFTVAGPEHPQRPDVAPDESRGRLTDKQKPIKPRGIPMAQDKRGRPPEPPVDEVMNELVQEEGGDDFVAGPTQRNDVGNTKRAAAKATGVMGATKKLDPDLDIDHVDDGRVQSGSKAGLHSFKEVPPEEGTDAGFEL